MPEWFPRIDGRSTRTTPADGDPNILGRHGAGVTISTPRSAASAAAPSPGASGNVCTETGALLSAMGIETGTTSTG